MLTITSVSGVAGQLTTPPKQVPETAVTTAELRANYSWGETSRERLRPATPPLPVVTGEMYTTARLRVREEPNGEVLDVLDFATQIEITDHVQDEWVRIVYQDWYAWVSSDYLSETKPEPPPPPEPPPAPEPEPQPTADPEPVYVAEGVWDRLAECESGGNWSINTGNGYYGGLQFSLGTWEAYGGSGMPHENSREEQIRIATKVRDARGGYGDWPACSAKLGLPT